MKILKDRRGYSMTFWTVFFGFVMIPIMALGIELGRYFYARAEIAKAADAAALAAAAEINQRLFEETGTLKPTSRTWANAQTIASMNKWLPFALWSSGYGNWDISGCWKEYRIGNGLSRSCAVFP